MNLSGVYCSCKIIKLCENDKILEGYLKGEKRENYVKELGLFVLKFE